MREEILSEIKGMRPAHGDHSEPWVYLDTVRVVLTLVQLRLYGWHHKIRTKGFRQRQVVKIVAQIQATEKEASGVVRAYLTEGSARR